MTAISARIGARCASSSGWTPSIIASTLPADDLERRPQLVGDVGEERLAVGAGPVEPLGHRVERGAQPADGTGAADRDADVGLAVGQAFRGGGDLDDGPDGPAEDARSEEDPEDEERRATTSVVGAEARRRPATRSRAACPPATSRAR